MDKPEYISKKEYIGKLDGEIDHLVSAITSKGNEYPTELRDIPGARDVHAAVDSPEMHSFLKGECDKIFGPWKDLPDPESFAEPIRQIREAKGKLANTEVTRIDEIENMQLGAQIPEYMSEVKTKLAGWRGETINAVHRNYVNYFSEMIFLQANTARVLELSLKAHQEGIYHAQTDMVNLVRNATAAIDAIDCWGGDAGKNTFFNLLAGLGAVVSLAIPGFNAVAVVTIGATTGLAVAKDLIESKPESHTLGAGRINEVWANMQSAVERHKTMYTDGESKMATIVSSFYMTLDGRIETGDGPTADSKETRRGLDLIRLSAPINTGDVQKPVA